MEKNIRYIDITNALTESYSRQIKCYRELKIIVQRILGQLSMSRGDFSDVMPLFEKKNRLMKLIDDERINSRKNVDLWQSEKEKIHSSGLTERFNKILVETEKAIKEFLDIEDQLKNYLGHFMVKGNK